MHALTRPAAVVALAIVLTACTRDGEIELIEKPPETRWRAVATEQDRERLRSWRKAWIEALPAARATAAGGIAAQGALFEPDQALLRAMPPSGDYKCRTFKLGSQPAGIDGFMAYPWFNCRVGLDGEIPTLVKLDGSQRPVGRLYAETDARVVFLGTLQLGDERTSLSYGQDDKRNMAGYVERVGTTRWRLVLPYPAFESQLDVIELVPA